MLAIHEPATVEVRRVKIEQLPMGAVGGDAEMAAEGYADQQMHGSVCGWTMLRRAYLMGWRAVPYVGTSTIYRRAYDAGLEDRRARCLDHDAWNEAGLWSDAIGTASLVRQGRELRFVLGFKAWHDGEPCPPGRSAFAGYRAAQGKQPSELGCALMRVLL